MEAVQVQQVMARDGEILITGLPYKRDQAVEVIIFLPPPTPLLLYAHSHIPFCVAPHSWLCCDSSPRKR